MNSSGKSAHIGLEVATHRWAISILNLPAETRLSRMLESEADRELLAEVLRARAEELEGLVVVGEGE